MVLQIPLALTGAVLLLFVGCGSKNTGSSTSTQSASKWKVFQSAYPRDDQVALLVRGEIAIKVMGSELLDELVHSIEDQGPASSIGVCADIAPLKAIEIGEEHRVRIGRTSFKLRNPKNAPPSWAAELVEQQTEKPLAFIGPGGTLGLLRPIKMEERCLTCHGDPETMEPEVLAAIGERYPDDAATGFAEGDIRGWFWVEIEPED